LLRELVGFEGAKAEGDPEFSLQKLAAATNVWGTLESEAVAVHTDAGVMILCRFALPNGLGAPPLTPAVIEDQGRRALVLCIAGTTVPLAGVNDQGVAAVRIAPVDTGDNYVVGVGPDGVALLRDVLLTATGIGIDDPTIDGNAPKTSEVGATLRTLAEAKQYVITRHATPGIWLTATKDMAIRYEWKAVGNDENVPGDLEFTVLKEVGALHAWAGYSAPELRDRARSWSSVGEPILAEELVEFGTGSYSSARLEMLLNHATELRIALWPEKRSVLMFLEGKLVHISLDALPLAKK